MPAGIFDDRFTSRDRPGWWDVGAEHVHHEAWSAVQALESIGEYDVQLVPLRATYAGSPLAIPNRAIVRSPIEHDDQPRVFGIAGPEYVLVTPRDVAELWDASVGQAVETMGALSKGELFFVTAKLPTIDVKGDEVENYMGLISPMDAMRAASVEVFPVRVVCTNTLNLAQSLATEVYKVVHDEHVKDRLASWLTQVYDEAVLKVQVVQEAFDILAGRKVKAPEVAEVLLAAYPEPNIPSPNAPEDVMKERLHRWEGKRDRIIRRREAARGLFEGDGTGMNTAATKGTSYGLYNAIAETEDWSRTVADIDSVTESLLIGPRAVVKRRAFDACMALSN
jgi:hypothetical protein